MSEDSSSKPYTDGLSGFRKDLTDLINKHSLETRSDTSDSVLANYLVACLTYFEHTVKARDSQSEPTWVTGEHVSREGENDETSKDI